jgi:hypothetical protein
MGCALTSGAFPFSRAEDAISGFSDLSGWIKVALVGGCKDAGVSATL